MALDPETGLVVMFGGQEGFGSAPTSEVWLFDPTNLVWALGERTDPTPSGKSGHALVGLDSTGGVALVGGSEGYLQPNCQSQRVSAGTVVDVWTFDASTLTWSQASSGNAPEDRWGHDVTLSGDGQTLVLFGGSAGPVLQLNPTADTWAYDIEAGTWTQVVTAQAPEPRTCHQMVTDPDTGLIYMFGGELGLSRGMADLWTFDLERGSWTLIESTGSSAPGAIWSHQMVYEPNSGLILVIGGAGIQTVQTGAGTTTNVGPLDGVWAFDPKTNKWESRKPMPYPLGMHAAVALGDGRVLVHGFGATLTYDVATDAWTDLTPDS
ncbi:MAG: kelch repeat-containing protein [Actinomycetota bacterium]